MMAHVPGPILERGEGVPPRTEAGRTLEALLGRPPKGEGATMILIVAGLQSAAAAILVLAAALMETTRLLPDRSLGGVIARTVVVAAVLFLLYDRAKTRPIEASVAALSLAVLLSIFDFAVWMVDETLREAPSPAASAATAVGLAIRLTLLGTLSFGVISEMGARKARGRAFDVSPAARPVSGPHPATSSILSLSMPRHSAGASGPPSPPRPPEPVDGRAPPPPFPTEALRRALEAAPPAAFPSSPSGWERGPVSSHLPPPPLDLFLPPVAPPAQAAPGPMLEEDPFPEASAPPPGFPPVAPAPSFSAAAPHPEARPPIPPPVPSRERPEPLSRKLPQQLPLPRRPGATPVAPAVPRPRRWALPLLPRLVLIGTLLQVVLGVSSAVLLFPGVARGPLLIYGSIRALLPALLVATTLLCLAGHLWDESAEKKAVGLTLPTLAALAALGVLFDLGRLGSASMGAQGGLAGAAIPVAGFLLDSSLAVLLVVSLKRGSLWSGSSGAGLLRRRIEEERRGTQESTEAERPHRSTGLLGAFHSSALTFVGLLLLECLLVAVLTRGGGFFSVLAVVDVVLGLVLLTALTAGLLTSLDRRPEALALWRTLLPWMASGLGVRAAGRLLLLPVPLSRGGPALAGLFVFIGLADLVFAGICAAALRLLSAPADATPVELPGLDRLGRDLRAWRSRPLSTRAQRVFAVLASLVLLEHLWRFAGAINPAKQSWIPFRRPGALTLPLLLIDLCLAVVIGVVIVRGLVLQLSDDAAYPEHWAKQTRRGIPTFGLLAGLRLLVLAVSLSSSGSIAGAFVRALAVDALAAAVCALWLTPWRLTADPPE